MSDNIEAVVERETQALGQRIWERLEHRAPSMFERRWWDDRILSWAMADESLKVQMFRFVDVLPMLRTHESVTQHLQEYFEEVREHLPWAARLGLDVSHPESILGRALAVNARSNALRMAERFIAGSSTGEVLKSVTKIRKQGFAFTLDLLGEAIISEVEAERYQQAYLGLIGDLSGEINAWPENVVIDRDHRGPIPRVNVSVKLSALYSQFNPRDPVGTTIAVSERLRTLLRSVRENGAYLHVDMEQYAYKDLTLAIFKTVLMEEEFRDFEDVGIVIQTYLPEAENDLKELLAWSKKRGRGVWVRLVKGAYWDYETVVAGSHGWPIPVYQQKSQSDVNFEKQSRFLLENYEHLRPALASHNLRSLANGIAWAQKLEVPQAAYEIQMLYGMADDQAQLFEEWGHRVRVYTPFGEPIPGMAYLVRRLLENTSNDSFLRHSFTENVSVEELFMNPQDLVQDVDDSSDEPTEPVFQNEPPSDFSQEETRERMQTALEEVAEQFGKEYSLVINGQRIETREMISSHNPSHWEQIVGRVSTAGSDEAVEAIDAARRAYRHWSKMDVNYRAEYLELVANEMRVQRYELAAWMVHECGKPWAEADADVAEAIDFCQYYAFQMRQMDEPIRCDVPGEENTYGYRSRGVVAVIAPWNFPLAILTGMTAAAIVTGNTVVMKPAEQSSVIAYKLMEIFEAVGLPDGVVNYLPGIGEDIGPELVGSPEIDMIAFTGSREVGLDINRTAADTDDRQRTIKTVIAELGGKNAIIVDEDADLDEAVLGVIQSAFGYAGQKCSACSRVVVLKSVYDAFLKRLIEATKSLLIGPAEEPGTQIGPVIDYESRDRMQAVIDEFAGDDDDEPQAKLALACRAKELADEGSYFGPHIFADVDPECELAQAEIFGPVLSVIKARNLDAAFTIANGTDYALTGGIFSRSPRNLKRARQEMEVGNLYLNRGITGALVERQPFGGFKMSGMGAKAGGPDYLQHFMIPVNVTENTMRRGFAPGAEEPNTQASDSASDEPEES